MTSPVLLDESSRGSSYSDVSITLSPCVEDYSIDSEIDEEYWRKYLNLFKNTTTRELSDTQVKDLQNALNEAVGEFKITTEWS